MERDTQTKKERMFVTERRTRTETKERRDIERDIIREMEREKKRKRERLIPVSSIHCS